MEIASGIMVVELCFWASDSIISLLNHSLRYVLFNSVVMSGIFNSCAWFIGGIYFNDYHQWQSLNSVSDYCTLQKEVPAISCVMKMMLKIRWGLPFTKRIFSEVNWH